MPRSLTSIAEDALTAAKALDGYLITNGLTFPSTEEDTLSDLPLELKETRNALVNSGQLLKQLALGAHGRLSEGMFAVCLLSHRPLTCPLPHHAYPTRDIDCRRDILGGHLQVPLGAPRSPGWLLHVCGHQQEVLPFRRLGRARSSTSDDKFGVHGGTNGTCKAQRNVPASRH